MRFGLHISIAGGIENAPGRAGEAGCECFQIFSRSPHGGAAGKLSADTAAAFRENLAQSEARDFFIHSPYYINFASGDPRIYHGSISAVVKEMEAAELLGAQGVVTHLGSAKDLGEEEAKEKLIAGLVKVFELPAKKAGAEKSQIAYRKYKVPLLLEITAGAGNIMGDTFEEIAYFIAQTEKLIGQDVLRVCFDSAHAFASGYDLRTEAAVKETLAHFDDTIGLDRIKLVHLNDSAVDLGAHVDRHANLGQGRIGLPGIMAILREFQDRDLDFVLETPPSQAAHDLELLKKIREGWR